MAILNDKTEDTKSIIHIMLTAKCDRHCPYCCNSQYDIDEIPVVTDEELKDAHDIYLTGGEPFAYSHPSPIARRLKEKYPNIENVRVYTNALELYEHIYDHGDLDGIDGLTISIKNKADAVAFERLATFDMVKNLGSIWVYVFEGFEDVDCPEGFVKKVRRWQKDFVAAPNSIFRKVPNMDKEVLTF